MQCFRYAAGLRVGVGHKAEIIGHLDFCSRDPLRRQATLHLRDRLIGRFTGHEHGPAAEERASPQKVRKAVLSGERNEFRRARSHRDPIAADLLQQAVRVQWFSFQCGRDRRRPSHAD